MSILIVPLILLVLGFILAYHIVYKKSVYDTPVKRRIATTEVRYSDIPEEPALRMQEPPMRYKTRKPKK